MDMHYSKSITQSNFKNIVLKMITQDYIDTINKFMVYIKNHKQSTHLYNTLKMSYLQ